MSYMFNNNKSKAVLEEIEFYLHTADRTTVAANSYAQLTLKSDTAIREGTDVIIGISGLLTYVADGVCLVGAYPVSGRYDDDENRYIVDVGVYNCTSSSKSVTSCNVYLNVLRNGRYEQ